MKECNMESAVANAVDKHIITFMKAQTVMTLATSHNNIPHSAMCFYVYLPDLNIIAFKSKPETQHVQQAISNPTVAGTILPDTFVAGKTSGIQYYGHFSANADLHNAGKNAYYKKYPFAAVIAGEVWIIEVQKIVFTDHTLGFGKKRSWSKEPASSK